MNVRKFAFTGTITSVDDIYGWLDASVTVGQPFTGYYIFDADTPDTNPEATVGEYRHTLPRYGLVAKMGRYVFRTDPTSVNFLIQPVDRPAPDGGDLIFVTSNQTVCSEPLPVRFMSWDLSDASGAALSTPNLSSDPPNLAAFAQNNFSVNLGPVGIQGVVNSIALDASAPPTAPPITIADGLELRFATEMGYFYQVQSSTDLGAWSDFQQPVLGTGDTHSMSFTRPPDPNTFFRAVIRNQPGLAANPADVLNFKFTGTVLLADGADTSVTEGSPVRGFYTFLKTAPDAELDPEVGQYSFATADTGVVVKVGNYVFRNNPQQVDFLIQTVNQPSEDSYGLISYNNVSSHPVLAEVLSWQLIDPSGTALSNDLLPQVPPTLANFDPDQSFLDVMGNTWVNGSRVPFLILARVDSIAASPLVIPEVPMLDPREALELRAPTVLGYLYQFQCSPDGAVWTDLGPPIIGDDTDAVRFVPPSDSLTYRVIITNP